MIALNFDNKKSDQYLYEITEFNLHLGPGDMEKNIITIFFPYW